MSRQPDLFGKLETGSPERPAVEFKGVHYFSKTVAGAPLKRPAWFFDTRQEGDGLTDVATHLVDLAQWEAFPEQALSPGDVKVASARRWATPIAAAQFQKVTGLAQFPDFLQRDVRDGALQDFANGEDSRIICAASG